MHDHRKWLMDAVEVVASGRPIKSWTRDSIRGKGFCAQAVRELIEGQLGYRANTWPVALEAQEVRKARGGSVRWATDYQKAAVRLGLAKPNKDRKPGDILYWPYTARDGNAYGHTAIYAGEKDGKEWVLENSDATPSSLIARGARQPLGPGTQVFLTPLSVRGEPALTAWPSAELRDAERPAKPAPKPEPAPAPLPVDVSFPPPVAPAPAPVRVLVNDGISGVWQDLTGKRFVIEGADEVTVNATQAGVIHIRYLDRR